MLVHAHPDDECSSTGGLICRCAREGHTSILVTCTNGEWGEVNDKRHRLRPRENPEDRRRLGEIRLDELKRAVDILGVMHHFPLGYRDSGMDGWESNGAPEAFANADPEEAAG
ncbi:MAG: PIG-L family deacetylase, partial [Nitrospinota bacterium]|nr:PIG-L family deacetylase [Nitrospinota bacterium]